MIDQLNIINILLGKKAISFFILFGLITSNSFSQKRISEALT